MSTHTDEALPDGFANGANAPSGATITLSPDPVV
jgi:hypothetical protein